MAVETQAVQTEVVGTVVAMVVAALAAASTAENLGAAMMVARQAVLRGRRHCKGSRSRRLRASKTDQRFLARLQSSRASSSETQPRNQKDPRSTTSESTTLGC